MRTAYVDFNAFDDDGLIAIRSRQLEHAMVARFELRLREYHGSALQDSSLKKMHFVRYNE